MMIRINDSRVSDILSENFGVSLQVYSNKGEITLRPTDLEYGEGFMITLSLEWRNITAEFTPDNFSAPLLRTMGQASRVKKEIFKTLAAKSLELYGDLTMEINRVIVNPLEPECWEKDWNYLYIKLLKMPIIPEELTVEEIENVIVGISGNLLSLVLSLLPLEESALDESIVGLPEGSLTRIEVNRYERSSFNRQACIKIQGCFCKVCGFNFEEIYGLLGQGFIHVHHIVPVSQMSPDYEVNPGTDLVPVCPNCHAMLHKRNPPFTVEELKSILTTIQTVGIGQLK